MLTPAEAAGIYVRAWSQPDAALRAQLIEQCFAANGRLLTRGRDIRGRSALAEEIARFWTSPAASELVAIRLVSQIDTGPLTFRLRGMGELRDGTLAESNDWGVVDAAGQIELVMTFSGPLGEAATPTTLFSRH